MKDVIILGIETSCDETAAAIVKNGREVLSNIVNSQIAIHQQFGGVVPEVASRKHIENIAAVVNSAFQEAGLSHRDIDAVAVTNMPGLIGALLVGLSFAKALAYGLRLPLITVNHLHGHIYANFLEHDDIDFPAVCLVVSGGHTSLLYMKGIGDYELIGSTKDDAAGEAFDKVARFLGLGYPGGPAVERAARQGQAGLYHLPRVFLDRNDYEFSFSGLKTAAMNLWRKIEKTEGNNPGDIAAEFQAALVDVLVEKTMRAAEKYKVKTIMMAGGVAANKFLRENLAKMCKQGDYNLYYPSLALCTDNAAMIAGKAYHDYNDGLFAPLNTNAHATQFSL
ncbi:MAG: tRNA (adenosine(37)-N6)-threonylcarbamoyltransferase complex transferase subunit TsaD [Syntrophomonadaceae bacterium]|nr:tRNA (adenosine(37)-N6)-threonylcarbamoyltransferase complex transferase subunit TsaD [Syntrophomonadaceae bacterium]